MTISRVEYTIQEVKEHLTGLLKRNIAIARGETQGLIRTPILWSKPGLGKSSIVRQVCEELSLELYIHNLALKSPIDIQGAMTVNEKAEDLTTEYARPSWIPRQDDTTPRVIFVDEFTQAVPTTQNTMMSAFLEHRIDRYHFPRTTLFVCAANYMEDKAATFSMPSPMKNRVRHLHVKPDLDSWLRYAVDEELHENVVAFMRFKGEQALYSTPGNGEMAFATPRSWEFVSELEKEAEYCGYTDKKLLLHLNMGIAGEVGSAATTEYMAFRQYIEKIPSPEETIVHGQVFQHSDPSLMHAHMVSVLGRAERMRGDLTREMRKNVVNMILELPSDMAYVAIKILHGFEDKKEYHQAAPREMLRVNQRYNTELKTKNIGPENLSQEEVAALLSQY